MKTLSKTLALAFIGTLILTSCSNAKATASTKTTTTNTSTKTKTAFDAQAKDSKTKNVTAVKLDPKRVSAASATTSRKALTPVTK